MTRTPVIYDGDMGGDDLWAIGMLLAHRDRFDISGISTVYGNVSQPLATRNIQNFLHWLGIDGIPVVMGANAPCDGMRPFGDDAYGENGVGGYTLPESPIPTKQVAIAEWLNTQLHAQASKTIVFATGPATNLAHLVQKYPESIKKIDKIIFMGGAIEPIGNNFAPIFENGTRRIGNITIYSEFNAYQDPKALNILLEAGAPITFMAADASQYMVLTPDRQKRIQQIDQTYGPAFHRMLMAVEHLDRLKFGVDGPFIHDPNVITYALRPDLYESKTLNGLAFTESDPRGEDGDRRGQAILTNKATSAEWLIKAVDPDEIFEIMFEALTKTASQAP